VIRRQVALAWPNPDGIGRTARLGSTGTPRQPCSRLCSSRVPAPYGWVGHAGRDGEIGCCTAQAGAPDAECVGRSSAKPRRAIALRCIPRSGQRSTARLRTRPRRSRLVSVIPRDVLAAMVGAIGATLLERGGRSPALRDHASVATPIAVGGLPLPSPPLLSSSPPIPRRMRSQP
jgi:hypothetical protein